MCFGEINLLQMHVLLFLLSEFVMFAFDFFFFFLLIFIYRIFGQLYQYFLMSYVFVSC